VESGYEQAGVGGATGAGISAIGGYIGGPVGAVMGTIGSITSLLSGLFTQAAQNIGKEVAKAVDEVMEKYSTGQLSLNDTITQVQEQITQLVL
jgi:isocitrate/isopropylmalate dehydrogenase